MRPTAQTANGRDNSVVPDLVMVLMVLMVLKELSCSPDFQTDPVFGWKMGLATMHSASLNAHPSCSPQGRFQTFEQEDVLRHPLVQKFGWKMGFELRSSRADTIEKKAQTKGRAINHFHIGSTLLQKSSLHPSKGCSSVADTEVCFMSGGSSLSHSHKTKTGDLKVTCLCVSGWKMGFEPTTLGTTILYSNQLSYIHHLICFQIGVQIYALFLIIQNF